MSSFGGHSPLAFETPGSRSLETSEREPRGVELGKAGMQAAGSRWQLLEKMRAEGTPIPEGRGLALQQFEKHYSGYVESKVMQIADAGHGERLEAAIDSVVQSDQPFPPAVEKHLRMIAGAFSPDNKGLRLLKPNKGALRVNLALTKELDFLEKLRPQSAPIQQEVIDQHISLLKQVLACDPQRESYYDWNKQRGPSKLGELAPAGRMIGFMLASGVVVANLIAAKGKITAVSALYAGLAFLAFNGGLPKGKEQKEIAEVSFLATDNNYQKLVNRYRIQGKEWADISQTVRDSKSDRSKLISVLKNKRKTDEEKKEAYQEYVETIAPDRNSAVHGAVRDMPKEDLFLLCSKWEQSASQDSQQTIYEWILKGVGPQSLAPQGQRNKPTPSV